jgi:hypothetical protein
MNRYANDFELIEFFCTGRIRRTRARSALFEDSQQANADPLENTVCASFARFKLTFYPACALLKATMLGRT